MEGSISATVQSKTASGILYAVPVFHLQKDFKKLEQVQKMCCRGSNKEGAVLWEKTKRACFVYLSKKGKRGYNWLLEIHQQSNSRVGEIFKLTRTNGYELATNKFLSEAWRLFLIKRVKLAHRPYNNGYPSSAEKTVTFFQEKKKERKQLISNKHKSFGALDSAH